MVSWFLPTRGKSPKNMSQDYECQTFPIFPLLQPVRTSIFHGEAGDDSSRWLKEYERFAKFNRWDNTMCLANAFFERVSSDCGTRITQKTLVPGENFKNS
ncbi:hypothetical protein TNCV_4515291 [Trichonephila clavipes]|nr:hypothetical protein TNCV_4515291 [Trichonephila clavipes]